jgi:hypothetical protein
VRHTKLHIPYNITFFEPALRFISAYASTLPISKKQNDQILEICSSVINFTIKCNQPYQNISSAEIQILLSNTESQLSIEVLNKGCPIFLKEFDEFLFQNFSMNHLQVQFQNFGRKGQSILIQANFLTPSNRVHSHSSFNQKESYPIQIRPLKSGEELELSRLFYRVYRYKYINEFVYFPEKLEKMISDGQLISTVAEAPDGSLVGHVGLVRWSNYPPVYEAALGVVDPIYKNNGVFGKVFHETMEVVNRTSMQYCVFDLVTNHDFSQRLVSKYQSHETALFLGNQVSETQVKLSDLGIGSDPEDMDRYSLLVGIRPRVSHPFGQEIILPTNIGEACEFLLKPLNIKWVPTPRFYPLPTEGDYHSSLQPEQKAAIFDFYSPGRQSLNRIIDEWHRLLREGFQYIAIDFPLDVPGFGQMYDLLAKHGFFLAGFVPYHFSERLGFRLQFITPTQVNLEKIKVYSETGKKLLKMVRTNYERNVVL